MKVFFYSRGIFLNAGISADEVMYAILATNAVFVAMTIVTVSFSFYSIHLKYLAII